MRQATTTLYYRQPPFLWLPVFMWKDLHECKTQGLLLTPSFSLWRVTHFIAWLGRRNQMCLAQSQLEPLLDFGLLAESHSKHRGADLPQERGLWFLFLPVPSEDVNVGVQEQEAIISKYLSFLIQFYQQSDILISIYPISALSISSNLYEEVGKLFVDPSKFPKEVS